MFHRTLVVSGPFPLPQESLWAPLQRLRSGFAPTEDVAVWWAAPEAVSLWGQAGSPEMAMVCRFASTIPGRGSSERPWHSGDGKT